MKKYLLITLPVLLCLMLPTDAPAARIWSAGMELQSGADNVEGDLTVTFPTVSTAIVHGGLASASFNPTNDNSTFAQDFLSAGGGSQLDVFVRIYLYIASAPDVA